jgi:hypothetical protein
MRSLRSVTGAACVRSGYVVNWRTDEPAPRAHAPAWSTNPRLTAPCRACELDDAEQRVLQQLGEHNPELINTRRLVQQFLRMVRRRGGRNLEAWVLEIDLSVRTRFDRLRKRVLLAQ